MADSPYKCFFCGGRVIHGGDHDIEGSGLYCDEYLVESNFHYVDCKAFYLVANQLATENA
jgi:hypothetical protein